MRILIEIGVWILGLGLMVALSRGLAPVAGGVLRVLVSPLCIGGVVLFVFLLRVRFGSTRQRYTTP